MEQPKTSSNRGNRFVNWCEARILARRVALLGSTLAQHTHDGRIRLPGGEGYGGNVVSAVVGEEGYYANLHGVIDSTGASLSGIVSATRSRRQVRAQISVTARHGSDTGQTAEYRFDSRDPGTRVTTEHLRLVSELRHRVIRGAGELVVDHATL